jgi:Sigma-54 interaction domain
MWNPSEVAGPNMRGGGPPDRTSYMENAQLSRASRVGRILLEMPRVNLLLVGINGEFSEFVGTRRLDLPQPVATWCPGERLVLPPYTQMGTLILHEVGDLSHDDQRQLLEWLEPAARRVQVISTTSASLFPRVEVGSFSDVLYYRLNTMCLDMSSWLEAGEPR